jgi:transitional endoplasmic reticulum ATPase
VDQIVDVPLPDEAARGRLIRLFARDFAPADEAEVARVAAATEGATPATLKEVAKRAVVMALRRAGRGADPAGVRCTAADLLLAYEQVGRMRTGEV